MRTGAESMKRVVPAADLRYFDAGHFPLDAFAEAIIETFSIGATRG